MADTCQFLTTTVRRPTKAIMKFVSHGNLMSHLGPVVFDAVRAVHPSTPILIFGGGGAC